MKYEIQESITKINNYLPKIQEHILKLDECYNLLSQRLALLNPTPGVKYPHSHRNSLGESVDDLIRVRISIGITQKELEKLIKYLTPITTLDFESSPEDSSQLISKHIDYIFEYNGECSSIYKLLARNLHLWVTDDVNKLLTHYDLILQSIDNRINQLVQKK